MLRIIMAIAVVSVLFYGYMKIKGRTFSQTQKDIKEKVDDTINSLKNNSNKKY